MAKRNKPKSSPPSNSASGKKSPQLNDIDIQVNQLGQIERNFDIDKINQFLNENVPDKKFNNDES